MKLREEIERAGNRGNERQEGKNKRKGERGREKGEKKEGKEVQIREVEKEKLRGGEEGKAFIERRKRQRNWKTGRKKKQ